MGAILAHGQRTIVAVPLVKRLNNEKRFVNYRRVLNWTYQKKMGKSG